MYKLKTGTRVQFGWGGGGSHGPEPIRGPSLNRLSGSSSFCLYGGAGRMSIVALESVLWPDVFVSAVRHTHACAAGWLNQLCTVLARRVAAGEARRTRGFTLPVSQRHSPQRMCPNMMTKSDAKGNRIFPYNHFSFPLPSKQDSMQALVLQLGDTGLSTTTKHSE